MSEPKWTPAQRAAIEDRGGALLVSAAAGSGKTAVLTERAVRLITDPEHPVDADRLLIVTFTNAAAAELRARIGQALLKRSQAEPGNGALRRQPKHRGHLQSVHDAIAHARRQAGYRLPGRIDALPAEGVKAGDQQTLGPGRSLLWLLRF